MADRYHCVYLERESIVVKAHQNLEWLALKTLNKSMLESIKRLRGKMAQPDGRHDSAGAIAPSG